METVTTFLHPNLESKIKFDGNIVFLGWGSIAQGTLPLILRHVDVSAKNIKIITSDDRGIHIAKEYSIEHIIITLTEHNYISILESHLKKGDFLFNLSVNVSSCDVLQFCQTIGVCYLDTCIEPWGGDYLDSTKSISERSNYWLREKALDLKKDGKSTCIITHGANPGMVSHLTKRALINIAKDNGVDVSPKTQADWAKLAQTLEIKVIHVAERDTQVGKTPKSVGEFVNTWSCDGFASEGRQCSELGFGTHEKQLPHGGKHHTYGRNSAIYLERHGVKTRVLSWVPQYGRQLGFLITHGEAITISDFLTCREEDKVVYRPTVHYAYHPCNDAILSIHEMTGSGFQMQSKQRILGEEIVDGEDALGVLLMGNKKGSYWFGSRLTVEEARKLVPHNQATTLQVTSAVLGGFIWALENPTRGLVEPEEMDHDRVLDIMYPYLGDVVGVYTDWTPLQDRLILFGEDLDMDDPWQFKNFLQI
jgi:homospermidine synthase